jgi:hypothetical protein
MAIRPEVLRALEAAGATLGMILAAIEAERAAEDREREAALVAKRAVDAERQRRHRASRPVTRDSRDKGVVTRDKCDGDQHSPNPLGLYNNNNPSLPSEARSERESSDAREPDEPSDWPDDFQRKAWEAYGQGREKKVSMQALVELKRSRKVPWQVLLDGMRRQAENVEPKFRPSLQRFIRREKWLDEYTPQAATGPPESSGQPSLALVHVNGTHRHVLQAGSRKSAFAEELARRKAENPYFRGGG